MGGSDAEFRAPRSELDRAEAQAAQGKHDDVHLRSCKAVAGYQITATDGDIGHVESLLMDEETWAINCLVVNTSNWWLGHQVLITPKWIRDVSWFSDPNSWQGERYGSGVPVSRPWRAALASAWYFARKASRASSSSSSRSSSALCAPWVARMISSSFTWIASVSRFCVF